MTVFLVGLAKSRNQREARAHLYTKADHAAFALCEWLVMLPRIYFKATDQQLLCVHINWLANQYVFGWHSGLYNKSLTGSKSPPPYALIQIQELNCVSRD